MEDNQYCYKYPHPAVTADNVIFGLDKEGLKVLLIQRKNEPYKNCWAFAGGFMNIDETIEQCAKRELKEETGFELQWFEQLRCFSDVDRDPRERVISVVFFSIVHVQEVKAGDDATQAQWFKITEIPQLAFDHDNILQIAVDKLKEKTNIKPFWMNLLYYGFSSMEVKRLYDIILQL